MILIVFVDLVITLGLWGVGWMLGFVLVLAGLPHWLLWFIPAWFGCSMPAARLMLGYPDLPSRRGGRPGHAQPPIASHPRRREPRLEDLYP